MRKILAGVALIAFLAAPVSGSFGNENIFLASHDNKNIEETVNSVQGQTLKRLKQELSKRFDYGTIDEIFKNPEFKIEIGVMHNWNGCKADGRKIKIKSYEDYRNLLEIEKIFDLKPEFMVENKDALEAAERKYNVDKKIIAGVLGIETKFGNNLGKYKTVNALVSTYILVERKRKFALAHLIELIKYSKKTNISLYTFKGSYAGATSIAQFLPWWLNRLYVGESGDVSKSHPYRMNDAIFSTAKYLDNKGFSKDPKSAIKRYNNSEMYYRAVNEIASFKEKTKL